MTTHARPDRQTAERTHARARAPSLQTALSKGSLAVFHFCFRPTDLSTELRWRPICSCTFKGARPHTRLLFIQKDTCSRNKLNQTSVLQTLFHIPRLHPDLLFYSPNTFSHPTTPKPSFSLPSPSFRLSPRAPVISQDRRANTQQQTTDPRIQKR